MNKTISPSAQIKTYFDSNSVSKHLKNLKSFRNSAISGTNLTDQTLEKKYKSILTLIDAATMLLSEKYALGIQKKTTINLIAAERQTLKYFPVYLKSKALVNPRKKLSKCLDIHLTIEYKGKLDSWFHNGIFDVRKHTPELIICYENIQKIIECCWLIHEREISKNSLKNLVNTDSECETSLLNLNDGANPFLAISDFFNVYGPTEWQPCLKDWFIAASIKDMSWRGDKSNLVFLYEKVNILLNAGYLIGNNIYDYLPQHLSHNKASKHQKYLTETLTLENIKKIRQGLQKWLYAGLSPNCTISDEYNDEQGYKLYKTLGKIIEAFYLIITPPFLKDHDNSHKTLQP